MILIQQLKLPLIHTQEQILKKAANALRIPVTDIRSFDIIRRSLDCRKKPELFYIYSLEVEVPDEKKVLKKVLASKGVKEQISVSDIVHYRFPEEMNAEHGAAALSPVIVGAGPAGLFCAYYLALAGMHPILIERGKPVEERMKDVELFWETGRLNPSSNVQFGEGGAGTFSDGKLNTLVKDKDGRNRAVLECFVRFGAKESILYDAKPHIGTDVLARVVKTMREEIKRLGGEIRFESCMTDLEIRDGEVKAVTINHSEKLPCKQVVLAIGHSARDTFEMLDQKKIPMEAKSFAVGFRVEHPQEMIDKSQYGFTKELSHLSDADWPGAAAYKLAATAQNGRGVYSFCMCPGGYVVNASSEEGRLAVNGMSYSGRNGRNANSAVIVSVTPNDYPGDGPLAGIAFQRELEEKAYRLGDGKIPAQRYGEFCEKVNRCSANADANSDLMPQTKGSYSWADLSDLLPAECSEAFVEGMTSFGRKIKGFDRKDAILLGVESRTSSPVRIHRDETLQSAVRGLYPCGEGAGYAGGITSAAMDGLRVAEEIKRQNEKR